MTGDRGTYACYVPHNFASRTLELIEHANRIVDDYERRGLVLTLRQLYYVLVTRNLLRNSQSQYDRLGSVISDARLAGLVSWTAIEDRTRNLRGLRRYESPAEALAGAADGYRIDLWHSQPWRPEVWIEKDALTGVIEGICDELRVDFFACRGYSSQSEQWRAGRRLAGYVARGQRPIILHLGDHDPSGLDMTRDNRDRLSMFAGAPVQVVRLGLNIDQVRDLGLAPNPLKSDDAGRLTDSRGAAYRRDYGDESWELDALDPEMLRDLIRDAVLRLRDPAAWDAALAEEAEDRRYLRGIVEDSE